MVVLVSSVIVAEFQEWKEPCVHDCMILNWIGLYTVLCFLSPMATLAPQYTPTIPLEVQYMHDGTLLNKIHPVES